MKDQPNTIDHAAEAITRDILADPAVRERLRALVLAAFRCNTDLEHHEHELASLKDRVAYLEAQGEQKR